MSKPRNPETEVTRYFMTADRAQAVMLYRVVRGILDSRGAFSPEVSKAPRPVRKVVSEPRVEAS